MSITWKGETLYKVREAATILGIQPGTVRLHIRSGKLAARLVLGVMYVADVELDRLLSNVVCAPPITATAEQRRRSEAASRELKRLLAR